MENHVPTPTEIAQLTRAHLSPSQAAWKKLKRNKTAFTSLIIISLILLVAVLAPVLAPYSFETQNVDRILESPTRDHWLGTDSLGRDMLSRLIYGSRMSMAVGVLTAFVSLILGGLYGAISGWAGGRTDQVMMRLIDILDSIPSLVLLIIVATIFSSLTISDNTEVKALIGILLSLSIVGWVSLARLVRGQVLQVKSVLYIESARALGASTPAILWRHVLPNILGPIIILLTFQIPANVLFESFLSFIGLGLQPPYSSWGVLANDGWRAKSYPHLILAPGIAIFVTMLAFNLFGDGLRDAVDPRK